MLPYSHSRTVLELAALLRSHPAGATWGPIAELMYTTWLSGKTFGSMRASHMPVTPGDPLSREATYTNPGWLAGVRACT